MFRLEPRATPSRSMIVLTPVLAVLATMIAGAILFAILGKDPIEAIRVIFIDPFTVEYSRNQLLVKAAPLILIAIGLSFGFRAGIWNIGAEGQFIMGAIAGGAVGLSLYPASGIWVLPLMALVAAMAGALWALIPAFFKIRFGANEILVSLMLVYVAEIFLADMVTGPLRNPDGFNFPQSRNFTQTESTTLPELISGTGIHAGVLAALVAVIAAYVLMERHSLGFQIRLSGLSPNAARFAGINPNMIVVLSLALSGALAGLAGLFEVTGPSGLLSTGFPTGFGFTAIIVAFLGRLHPIGILLAGLVMALTYIGGELAQFVIGLPSAAIAVFQGMLLFFLLAMDVLVKYRLRWASRKTGSAA